VKEFSRINGAGGEQEFLFFFPGQTRVLGDFFFLFPIAEFAFGVNLESVFSVPGSIRAQ
jgi:hypothetical protein